MLPIMGSKVVADLSITDTNIRQNCREVIKDNSRYVISVHSQRLSSELRNTAVGL